VKTPSNLFERTEAMYDLDISSHADTIVAILLACVIVIVALV
jgi:hypothetical protein